MPFLGQDLNYKEVLMDEQSLSIKTSSINHATPCFKILQNYSVSNSDKKCLLALAKALSDLNFHAKNVKIVKTAKIVNIIAELCK